MDPLSVLKTMWRYKWVSMPMVLLTALACAYGLLWAPGTYESKATFALAMPQVPTELEIEEDPQLAEVNMDNPYLRWRDTSLLAQVVIARAHSDEVGDRLEAQGLDAEYELVPPDGTGSGMMNLTVTADDPETASSAAAFLSEEFDRIMREVQKINGADDSYLIASIPVSGPSVPDEVFASRLRSTAVLGAGGVILLLGAVSLAQSIDRSRRARRTRPTMTSATVADSPTPDGPETSAAGQPRAGQSRPAHATDTDGQAPGGEGPPPAGTDADDQYALRVPAPSVR